jgi:hypothetical protein
MIIEVKINVPVGVTDADILQQRQTALALLDLDSVMDALNNRLEV